MMQRKKNHSLGFTLIELIIVISIVAVLLGIVLASLSQARENTRERKRIADLGSIQFALTLYNEQNRGYPSYDNGTEIGVGNAIDAVIKHLSGNIQKDQKNTGAGSKYSYWYDSKFTCSEPNQKVLIARTMEQSKNANYSKLCTNSNPDTTNGAGPNSFVVILKETY